jgi:TonB family protein
MIKALAAQASFSTLHRVFLKYAYAIPILVMLAALLLLGGLLLRHRASPEVSEVKPSQSSAPQPTAVAPAASPQPSHEKASARRVAPQPTIESSPAMAGDVVHRAVPTVPEKALRTIHGRVRVNVRVTVDGLGNVTGAAFASASPSRYFGNIALEAARDWKFSQGKSGRSWLVHFVFENSGVTVGERQLS